MSTSHFIPEVWAASILENFRNKAVLTGLANRDYEGDLKAGNTVHIPGIVDIQVKDYKTGVVAKPGGGGTLPRTTAPDEVSDTGIEIKVDQEKSFDFIVDDIDAARKHGDLDDGPFAAIAVKLEDSLRNRFELERYGAAGEDFDPALHEALMATTDAGVEHPVIGKVLQPGYRRGERVIRATKVLVNNPE